jgi:hypothetical protein
MRDSKPQVILLHWHTFLFWKCYEYINDSLISVFLNNLYFILNININMHFIFHYYLDENIAVHMRYEHIYLCYI